MPLITRILRACAAAGLSRVVLNLHHRPETIARVAGDGGDLGLTLRYSWEQPVLGSAGGPRHALPLLDGDPYLLLNGDTLATVDLRALWAHHHAHDALVTMALIPNPEPARFGGVLVDADGWITGFCRRGDPRPSFHFFSAQVVARSVFADLPDGVAGRERRAALPADDGRGAAAAARVRLRRAVHRGRHAGRLPPRARAAGRRGRRLAVDCRGAAGRRSIRRRASIAAILWDDVTRRRRRGARARASSPTACACRPGCTPPTRAWCRGPRATRSGRASAAPATS